MKRKPDNAQKAAKTDNACPATVRRSGVYCIIGNSAAGLAAIDSVRQVDPAGTIINISQEPHRPYSRCLLSYYLAGAINKDRLWIRPEDYYQRCSVRSYLGAVVEEIDIKNKAVKITCDKKTESVIYDKLLVATGAKAKGVGIKGEDKKGVFVLRTLDDADRILSMLGGASDIAILGGGLIGMRAACALKKRNKNVRVLVKSSHIFSQMLDFQAADILRKHLEGNGVKISTGVEAKEICGNGSVRGVILDDGTELPCQLIVIGKGVASNAGLLKDKTEGKDGILVDSHLLTSQPDIYAAGDVAQAYDILEEKNQVNAIWPAAVRQGRIAGANMAGLPAAYEGSCGMNSVDFFGLSAISFGSVRPPKEAGPLKGAGVEELIGAEFGKNIYRKIVLKNNRIIGGILINDVERHGIYLHLALGKIDVSDIKDILTDEYFDYAKVMPLIKRQGKNFLRPEYQDTVFSYEPIAEMSPAA